MLLKAVIGIIIGLSACDIEQDKQKTENEKPLNRTQLREFQVCEKDADCVYAQNGCCDCANGGEAIALNKSKLDQFRASFNCKEVFCSEKGRIPPCDSGLASCQNKLCTYTLKLENSGMQAEIHMDSIVMAAPWSKNYNEPNPLPPGWKKHVALQNIVTDYGGGKDNIHIGKGQTYFTYNGKIAIGFHGTFDPPGGM